MRMKGISLPVNAVIIIALAVMVLLMLAAFFGGGVGQMSSASVESAWSQGCNILKNTYNCDATEVLNIKTTDITGDGVEDSLLVVCRAKYKDDTLSEYWCRNKCCVTVITEGTPCKKDKDCQIGWGKGNWGCSSGHCCPSGKTWNSGTGVCD